VFSELQSHYLFEDRFGRPGKGNDKGKVEGLVGWIRRNYLVPMPRVASFAALNAKLIDDCRRRLGDRLRGHAETIGERLVRDLAVLHSLPATAYDACEKKTGRVSSLSLVRYRRNDYSVPTAYGHREIPSWLCRRGGDLVRLISSPGMPGPTSARIRLRPAALPALLEQKVGALDRQRRWSAGICPRSSQCSAGSWKRAWASAANASSSRSCDCW
jgi:hypothetical protein